MKNVRKTIVWLLIAMQLVPAQSLKIRDYVISNKSERRILNEIFLDSNMTSNEIIVVRQSKNWFNNSKTKRLNVNDTQTVRKETFEQKTIIDDFGNEKVVFVRSEFNISDTTTNINRKITFDHQINTPEYKQPRGRLGLTSEQKTNVKIGIFTPLVVCSAIVVPALIYKKNNPDKVNPYR